MQTFIRSTIIAALIGGCLTSNGFTQDDPPPELGGDAAPVHAASQSYTQAFNARDAQKLSDHWAHGGIYINRTTGDRVVGRDAIRREFEALFAQDDVPKLVVVTESVEFISPNVALERGAVTVEHVDDSTIDSDYQVVYVRQGGEWLIDRVTEVVRESMISNFERLHGLEWMIGTWIDESDDSSIEIECDWTKNKNYIYRKFSVSGDNGIESSGLQVIGWDPINDRIRSWLFDSNGVFVEGTWTQSSDQWSVRSVATLPDGASGSFTSLFQPLEEGRYAWRKINRVIDGEILPNVEQVIVTRR